MGYTEVASLSIWHSKFNKRRFTLIYKLIGSPDILELLMLMKTQNILSDREKDISCNSQELKEKEKIGIRITREVFFF